MNLARSPVAQKIFSEWHRCRGKKSGAFSRPFSCVWETLLESAKLLAASERTDAEKDVREFQSEGVLEIKTERYRPGRIAQISIPFSAEPAWFQAFGFSPFSGEDARKIKEHPWEPRLAFVANARVAIPFSDLLGIDEFLKQSREGDPVVPIKERSLQIFGDEKRLDSLVDSALFRAGCLRLAEDLRCEKIGVPFGWKRGPVSAAGNAVIVLENAASWHSYCRWNEQRGGFSAVVYGDGNRFLDSVRYFPELFEELGGVRPIFYFGDIDRQGLVIPQKASRSVREMGVPSMKPHLWSYRALLKIDNRHFQREEKEGDEDGESAPVWEWMEDCSFAAREIIVSGGRLAQEHLGWEFLRTISAMD